MPPPAHPTAQSPSSSSASDAASARSTRVTSSLPSKRLRVEEVESLLSQIPPEFLRSKDFNPFSHYDDSVEELQGYHDVVKEAIDLIVDVHAKGFNSATAAFSHVVDSFASSQSTVHSLLTTLSDSRRLLTSRSEHLKEYWTQTATLTAINATLAKLAYIQTLPSHLATLTSHKLYLPLHHPPHPHPAPDERGGAARHRRPPRPARGAAVAQEFHLRPPHRRDAHRHLPPSKHTHSQGGGEGSGGRRGGWPRTGHLTPHHPRLQATQRRGPAYPSGGDHCRRRRQPPLPRRPQRRR